MKKKLLLFFVFSFFFLLPNVFAVDTSLKIYDDADLLTDSEEVMLKSQIDQYIKDYNMDMVLMTTLINPYGSTEELATRFYSDNGFGMNEHQDGILFVIDRHLNADDAYILTTGEAMRVYTDSRIDAILDDISDAKYNNEGYYGMFSAFIESSSDFAHDGVPDVNKNTYIDSNGEMKYKRTIPWFLMIVLSLTISSVIIFVLVKRNKMVQKATTAKAYLDQNSIQYSRKEDHFAYTHTTSAYVPRNTGGSSGGGSHHVGGTTSHGGHGGGGRRL